LVASGRDARIQVNLHVQRSVSVNQVWSGRTMKQDWGSKDDLLHQTVVAVASLHSQISASASASGVQFSFERDEPSLDDGLRSLF